MKERRKRQKRQANPLLKGLVSLIALGAILYFGVMAVQFCLGLFVVGDYVVTLPGETSPVLQQPALSVTEPGADSGFVPVTEVTRADLLATGDLMLHLPIVTSAKSGSQYDFQDIFQYVAPYVSKADYSVVNLETTLSGTDGGKEYTGYPKFNSPDSIVDAAAGCGFDMMLTANNHCYDYGTAGLKRTLEVVQNGGLATLGTVSSAEAPSHVVKDISGIKIGMVCYSYGQIGDNPDRPSMNDLPTDSAAAGLINAFDYNKLDLFYEEMTTQIADMRAKGAEAIVLYIHWGDEYSTSVTAAQKAIAQKMCDLGVDVIAGSHPHVVQPMELLSSTVDETHKTVCVYSMGNFLSNQRATNVSLTTGHTEDSLLFSFSFSKYSDGTVSLQSISILPTWVQVHGSGNNRVYRILPLDYQAGNWNELYGLSSTDAENAKNSYNRTMELVNDGLKAAQNYLDIQRVSTVGVG